MSDTAPEAYYLADFRVVLDTVLARDGDLFDEEEGRILRAFQGLSRPAAALAVRMLMRKGPWFRADDLVYTEVGEAEAALQELAWAGFVDREPDLEALLDLMTRPELAAVLGGARSLKRDAVVLRLREAFAGRLEVLRQDLCGRLGPARLAHLDLWRRVLVCFFGNQDQDLSAFVLADMGRLRYEPYPVDPGARAFRERRELEDLLALRGLREALEAGDVDLEALTAQVLALDVHPGLRQQRRFHGLLNALGQAWERRQDSAQALACYRRSARPPARERQVRLLAAAGDLEPAVDLALVMAGAPLDMGETRFVRTFFRRHRKALPLAAAWLDAHPEPPPVRETSCSVPRDPDRRVEELALEAARAEGWEGFHGENLFWKALFALAFWDIWFQPVPGAFLHPFQGAPLDLASPAFHGARAGAFEARLAEVARLESPADLLLARADAVWGTVHAFVSWKHLDRTHLEAALSRMSGALLAEVLRPMTRNPLAFDSGFPDLLLYRPDGRDWALREVKGPGDTLRPEQAWWLAHFQSLGADAAVLKVTWAQG